VAVQTGQAVIFITTHFRMLVIHVTLVVLMATQAGKDRIVGWIAVTFGATVPFTPVLPRIDGKKQTIMFCESGRFPPGYGGVALHTNIANSGCDVVGIGG
jgi:hypothetical protein